MARDSRNLINYNNARLYFTVLYSEEPYPKSIILLSWIAPSTGAFVDDIIRRYYFNSGAPLLSILLAMYIFWGIWILVSLRKRKYPLWAALLYIGSGYMLALIYFFVIIIRALIMLGDINLILLGLFSGFFLAFIVVKFTTGLINRGILSGDDDGSQSKKPTVPRWVTDILFVSSGWMGVTVTSFIFERFVPEGATEGIGFLAGFHMVVYCILMFFVSSQYYKVYLLRKFGLTDIETDFGDGYNG